VLGSSLGKPTQTSRGEIPTYSLVHARSVANGGCKGTGTRRGSPVSLEDRVALRSAGGRCMTRRRGWEDMWPAAKRRRYVRLHSYATDIRCRCLSPGPFFFFPSPPPCHAPSCRPTGRPPQSSRETGEPREFPSPYIPLGLQLGLESEYVGISRRDWPVFLPGLRRCDPGSNLGPPVRRRTP